MHHEANLKAFKQRLITAELDVAVVTDEDNIYYLTGYYDYLHMDFGRPTILIVETGGCSTLLTPAMEADMATDAAKVDRFVFWNDGQGTEWRGELNSKIGAAINLGLETLKIPALVKSYLDGLVDGKSQTDLSPILDEMRMIKSAEEIQLARHAGQVAMAMMEAGRDTIRADIPEYEVALATSRAGTLKAAELLSEHFDESAMSPNTHFLQIMASGSEITKPHHRASAKMMRHGEPVFLCFCGMTNFHRFKLGFDRTFWIGEIGNPDHSKIYQIAVESQAAALSVLKPGVTAESVHAAYASVIQDAGFEYPFRCGRATGYSFLEKPQLVHGDQTIIQPGMVLAIDGSVTVSGEFRAQVGDSVVVTNEGYELLTQFPTKLSEVII